LWSWAEIRGSPPNRSWGRTSFPSYTSSPPATTACASTPPPTPSDASATESADGTVTESEPRPRKRIKKAEAVEARGALLRSRKIRVVPTSEQREALNKVFGIARYVYNQCVTAEENGLIQGASVKEKYRWRKLFTTRADYVEAGEEWKDAATCFTMQASVESFFAAKKAALTNVVRGNAARFAMKKRSKYRSRQETLSFERYGVIDGAPAHVHISQIGKLRVRGELPREMRGRADKGLVNRSEVKITRTRLGYYYATVTVEIEQRPTMTNDMLAMDPGCRTFQTWYSDNGTCGKVGKFDVQQRALEEADALKSRMDKEGSRHNAAWRRRTRRQFLRALERVRNRTADLHHKVASWMCSNFRLILIPTFATQRMLSQGFLRSKTCRAMQTWSHYSFRRFLTSHAQLYTHTKALECGEHFTTKQCGRCGAINNVGGSEVFRCHGCGYTADRDYKSARDILAKHLPYIMDL
jgi:transposase